MTSESVVVAICFAALIMWALYLDWRVKVLTERNEKAVKTLREVSDFIRLHSEFTQKVLEMVSVETRLMCEEREAFEFLVRAMRGGTHAEKDEGNKDT